MIVIYSSRRRPLPAMDEPTIPQHINYTPEEINTLTKGVRENLVPTTHPAFVSDSKPLAEKYPVRPRTTITKKTPKEVADILAERERRQQEKLARRVPAEQATYPNPTSGLHFGDINRDDTRDTWYVREREAQHLQDKLERLSQGQFPISSQPEAPWFSPNNSAMREQERLRAGVRPFPTSLVSADDKVAQVQAHVETVRAAIAKTPAYVAKYAGDTPEQQEARVQRLAENMWKREHQHAHAPTPAMYRGATRDQTPTTLEEGKHRAQIERLESYVQATLATTAGVHPVQAASRIPEFATPIGQGAITQDWVRGVQADVNRVLMGGANRMSEQEFVEKHTNAANQPSSSPKIVEGSIEPSGSAWQMMQTHAQRVDAMSLQRHTDGKTDFDVELERIATKLQTTPGNIRATLFGNDPTFQMSQEQFAAFMDMKPKNAAEQLQHQIIKAGPGAGKTALLSAMFLKVAASGTPMKSVALMSPTKSGAGVLQELVDRVRNVLPEDRKETFNPRVSTVASYAYNTLFHPEVDEQGQDTGSTLIERLLNQPVSRQVLTSLSREQKFESIEGLEKAQVSSAQNFFDMAIKNAVPGYTPALGEVDKQLSRINDLKMNDRESYLTALKTGKGMLAQKSSKDVWKKQKSIPFEAQVAIYERAQRSDGEYRFDQADILSLLATQIEKSRVPAHFVPNTVMGDEIQDAPKIMSRLFAVMAKRGTRMIMAGDPSQVAIHQQEGAYQVLPKLFGEQGLNLKQAHLTENRRQGGYNTALVNAMSRGISRRGEHAAPLQVSMRSGDLMGLAPRITVHKDWEALNQQRVADVFAHIGLPVSHVVKNIAIGLPTFAGASRDPASLAVISQTKYAREQFGTALEKAVLKQMVAQGIRKASLPAYMSKIVTDETPPSGGMPDLIHNLKINQARSRSMGTVFSDVTRTGKWANQSDYERNLLTMESRARGQNVMYGAQFTYKKEQDRLAAFQQAEQLGDIQVPHGFSRYFSDAARDLKENYGLTDEQLPDVYQKALKYAPQTIERAGKVQVQRGFPLEQYLKSIYGFTRTYAEYIVKGQGGAVTQMQTGEDVTKVVNAEGASENDTTYSGFGQRYSAQQLGSKGKNLGTNTHLLDFARALRNVLTGNVSSTLNKHLADVNGYGLTTRSLPGLDLTNNAKVPEPPKGQFPLLPGQIEQPALYPVANSALSTVASMMPGGVFPHPEDISIKDITDAAHALSEHDKDAPDEFLAELKATAYASPTNFADIDKWDEMGDPSDMFTHQSHPEVMEQIEGMYENPQFLRHLFSSERVERDGRMVEKGIASNEWKDLFSDVSYIKGGNVGHFIQTMLASDPNLRGQAMLYAQGLLSNIGDAKTQGQVANRLKGESDLTSNDTSNEMDTRESVLTQLLQSPIALQLPTVRAMVHTLSHEEKTAPSHSFQYYLYGKNGVLAKDPKVSKAFWNFRRAELEKYGGDKKNASFKDALSKYVLNAFKGQPREVLDFHAQRVASQELTGDNPNTYRFSRIDTMRNLARDLRSGEYGRTSDPSAQEQFPLAAYLEQAGAVNDDNSTGLVIDPSYMEHLAKHAPAEHAFLTHYGFGAGTNVEGKFLSDANKNTEPHFSEPDRNNYKDFALAKMGFMHSLGTNHSKLGIPMAMLYESPIRGQLEELAQALELTGVVDPHAQQRQEDGSFMSEGAGVSLSALRTRLEEHLTARMGPLEIGEAERASRYFDPEGLKEHIAGLQKLPNRDEQIAESQQALASPRFSPEQLQQQLAQVKQAQKLTDPEQGADYNRMVWAHTVNAIMRASTGNAVVDMNERWQTQHAHSLFSHVVKGFQEGNRTLESTAQLVSALEAATSTMQQTGNIRRGDMTDVLQALGQPTDRESNAAMRVLEGTHGFTQPESVVPLSALTGDSHKALMGLTRYPMTAGLDYTFTGDPFVEKRGSTNEYGVIGQLASQQGLVKGDIGTLEPFDEKTPFGMPKSYGVLAKHSLLDPTRVGGRDSELQRWYASAKQKDHPMLNRNAEPVFQFVTADGKRVPVRASQLALAGQQAWQPFGMNAKPPVQDRQASEATLAKRAASKVAVENALYKVTPPEWMKLHGRTQDILTPFAEEDYGHAVDYGQMRSLIDPKQDNVRYMNVAGVEGVPVSEKYYQKQLEIEREKQPVTMEEAQRVSDFLKEMAPVFANSVYPMTPEFLAAEIEKAQISLAKAQQQREANEALLPPPSPSEEKGWWEHSPEQQQGLVGTHVPASPLAVSVPPPLPPSLPKKPRLPQYSIPHMQQVLRQRDMGAFFGQMKQGMAQSDAGKNAARLARKLYRRSRRTPDALPAVSHNLPDYATLPAKKLYESPVLTSEMLSQTAPSARNLEMTEGVRDWPVPEKQLAKFNGFSLDDMGSSEQQEKKQRRKKGKDEQISMKELESLSSFIPPSEPPPPSLPPTAQMPEPPKLPYVSPQLTKETSHLDPNRRPFIPGAGRGTPLTSWQADTPMSLEQYAHLQTIATQVRPDGRLSSHFRTPARERQPRAGSYVAPRGFSTQIGSPLRDFWKRTAMLTRGSLPDRLEELPDGVSSLPAQPTGNVRDYWTSMKGVSSPPTIPVPPPPSAVTPPPIEPSMPLPEVDPITALLSGDPARGMKNAPDAQQRAFIESDATHKLLQAGPGAGKTETIAKAVEMWMLKEGVHPGQVLSFSALKSGKSALRSAYEDIGQKMFGGDEKNAQLQQNTRTFAGAAFHTVFHSVGYGDEKTYPVLHALGVRGKPHILSDASEDELADLSPEDRDMYIQAGLTEQFRAHYSREYGEELDPSVAKEQVSRIQALKKQGMGPKSAYASELAYGQRKLATGERPYSEEIDGTSYRNHIYTAQYQNMLKYTPYALTGTDSGRWDFEDLTEHAIHALRDVPDEKLPPWITNAQRMVIDEGQDVTPHHQEFLTALMRRMNPKERKSIVGMDVSQSAMGSLGGTPPDLLGGSYHDMYTAIDKGVTGTTVEDHTLLHGYRGSVEGVYANNAFLKQPAMAGHAMSPLQTPGASAPRGVFPRLQGFLHQGEQNKAILESMVKRTGLSFDVVKQNIAAWRQMTDSEGKPYDVKDMKAQDLFANMPWNTTTDASGKVVPILPKHVPLISSVNDEHKVFQADLRQNLMHLGGLDKREAKLVAKAMYRKNAPRQGEEWESEMENANYQFWGMTNPGSRSHGFMYPQIVSTRRSMPRASHGKLQEQTGWSSLDWQRQMFIGNSRSIKENAFYATDRNLTGAQAEQYSKGKSLIWPPPMIQKIWHKDRPKSHVMLLPKKGEVGTESVLLKGRDGKEMVNIGHPDPEHPDAVWVPKWHVPVLKTQVQDMLRDGVVSPDDEQFFPQSGVRNFFVRNIAAEMGIPVGVRTPPPQQMAGVSQSPRPTEPPPPIATVPDVVSTAMGSNGADVQLTQALANAAISSSPGMSTPVGASSSSIPVQQQQSSIPDFLLHPSSSVGSHSVGQRPQIPPMQPIPATPSSPTISQIGSGGGIGEPASVAPKDMWNVYRMATPRSNSATANPNQLISYTRMAPEQKLFEPASSPSSFPIPVPASSHAHYASTMGSNAYYTRDTTGKWKPAQYTTQGRTIPEGAISSTEYNALGEQGRKEIEKYPIGMIGGAGTRAIFDSLSFEQQEAGHEKAKQYYAYMSQSQQQDVPFTDPYRVRTSLQDKGGVNPRTYFEDHIRDFNKLIERGAHSVEVNEQYNKLAALQQILTARGFEMKAGVVNVSGQTIALNSEFAKQLMGYQQPANYAQQISANAPPGYGSQYQMGAGIVAPYIPQYQQQYMKRGRDGSWSQASMTGPAGMPLPKGGVSMDDYQSGNYDPTGGDSGGGGSSRGGGNSLYMISNVVRHVTDLMSSLGQAALNNTQKAVLEGSSYRQATTGMADQSVIGSWNGTTGFWNFKSGDSMVYDDHIVGGKHDPNKNITNYQAAYLPEYSDTQIAQNFQALTSSTGEKFSIGGQGDANRDIMGLAWLTGMDPTQLTQQLAAISGSQGQQNAQNPNWNAQNMRNILGMVRQLTGQNMSSSNVPQILDALQNSLPYAQGINPGGISSATGQKLAYSQTAAPEVMAVLQTALNAGMSPGNLGTVSDIYNTFAQIGTNPNLEQQYTLNQMPAYAGKLTGDTELTQFQQSQLQSQQQLAGLRLQQNILGDVPTGGTEPTTKPTSSDTFTKTPGGSFVKAQKLSLPQLQLQIDKADIQMQAANLTIAGVQLGQSQNALQGAQLNYQYGVASYNENLMVQNQMYGKIGQDTSRSAYFAWQQNQNVSGYNQTSPNGYANIPSTNTFGVKNAEFYANMENQRAMLIDQQSPLLKDAAFEQQMKYINQQEAFYKQELAITNEQRSFEQTWQLKLLNQQASALEWQKKMVAAQGAAYAIQVKQYANSVLMNAYQQKMDKINQAFLDKQTAALNNVLVAIQQKMSGQIGANGSPIDPAQLLQSIANEKLAPQELQRLMVSMQIPVQDRQALFQLITQIQNSHLSLADIQKQLASATDAQLQADLKKYTDNGSTAGPGIIASGNNTNLQMGGTTGDWSNLISATATSESMDQSMAHDLSPTGGIQVALGKIASYISPIGGIISTITGIGSFFAGLTQHTGGLGKTGVSPWTTPTTGITKTGTSPTYYTAEPAVTAYVRTLQKSGNDVTTAVTTVAQVSAAQMQAHLQGMLGYLKSSSDTYQAQTTVSASNFNNLATGIVKTTSDNMLATTKTLTTSVNAWLAANNEKTAVLAVVGGIADLFKTPPGTGGVAESAGGGVPQAPGGFTAPHVNAAFGQQMWYGRHNGVDFAANQGTPIEFFNDGEVTGAGFYPWGGEIDQQIAGTNLTERYLHLSQISVAKGQKIKAGQRMGLTGGGTPASGLGFWSKGPHSHVQVDAGNINQGINPWLVWALLGPHNISQYYGSAASSGAFGYRPPSGGGGIGSIGDIPALHMGGIAMSPTLAHIGEGGQPEAIMPLDKLAGMMQSLLTSSASVTGARASASSSSPTHITLTIQSLMSGGMTVNCTQDASGKWTISDSDKDDIGSNVMDAIYEALTQATNAIH